MEAQAEAGTQTELIEFGEPRAVAAPAESAPVAAGGVSITVTPDDTAPGALETFTLQVKKFSGNYGPTTTGPDGAEIEGKPILEVVETYAGLPCDGDAVKNRTADSKHIVVTDEVLKKIDQALTQTKMLRAVALRRGQIHEDFKALVEAAKYDPAADTAPTDDGTEEGKLGAAERARKILAAEVARDKLRVWAGTGNKELGMRLAQMNRKQRQAFWASLKTRKTGKQRVDRIRAKREKARAARKARR